MIEKRRLLFLAGGFIFAILVLILPVGSIYKSSAALALAAIVLLFLYPVTKHK